MNAYLVELIASTKKNTAHLVDHGEVSWSVARSGVLKVMTDLQSGWPDRADWIRDQFAPWIQEQDARHPGPRLVPGDDKTTDL